METSFPFPGATSPYQDRWVARRSTVRLLRIRGPPISGSEMLHKPKHKDLDETYQLCSDYWKCAALRVPPASPPAFIRSRAGRVTHQRRNLPCQLDCRASEPGFEWCDGDSTCGFPHRWPTIVAKYAYGNIHMIRARTCVSGIERSGGRAREENLD